MKKLAFILLLMIYSTAFSQQIIETYTHNDSYYEGDYEGLITDMVRIVKENNIQPCSVSEEYFPTILVNLDSTINVVKDFDSLKIAENKCAFDFTKQVLPHLKKWKTWQRKGTSYPAITKFKVTPFFIYHSELNPKNNKYTPPEFSKGINEFRNYVADVFSHELIKNRNTFYYLNFIVDENGEMKDLDVEIYPEEVIKNKKSLISQVLKIRGKWTPAKFNNVSFKKAMRLPMKQEHDMEWEKKIQDFKFKTFQNK